MRIQNFALTLDGTDMTADIESNPIYTGHVSDYSVQLVYTGTPNGNFIIEGSNDIGAQEGSLDQVIITNWSTVSTTNVTAAGNHITNVTGAGYRWIRLTWVDNTSASTPTITVAQFNGKGF